MFTCLVFLWARFYWCEHFHMGLQIEKKKSLRLTPCILTWIFIFSLLFSVHFIRCWHREFYFKSRASLVGHHFLYFHHLNVWCRGDIAWRSWKLVILWGQMVTQAEIHQGSRQMCIKYFRFSVKLTQAFFSFPKLRITDL